MRDGWAHVALGDVVEQVKRKVKVEPGCTYPLLGVRWYGAGPFHRETVTSDTSKAANLYQVAEGDFIYNRLFAWKGSFGTIGADLDGHYVSGEFPLFRCDTHRLHPRYLNLVMTRPDVWTQIERESTGSTATSRNRWKEERFLHWEVALPSLVVQRRVVDLVDAVDTYAAAAGRAAAETRRALDAHLEGFDTWTVSDGTALGDLASMGSGPSWKAEQERSVAGPGTLPVVKITNTRPDGRLVMDERAFVADLPASTGVLDEDSLVMIRTNGNRDRIGNVYRSTPETVGHAVSAFQIAVHPSDPADSAYLFWYLRSPRVQRLISEAASGTTGLGNVAVRWLRQLEVPWPDASTRAVFVDTAEAVLTASESGSDVGEGLSGLRSALLGELLSGEREIPGSYDELVGLVA